VLYGSCESVSGAPVAERTGAELASGEGGQGKGEEAGTLWRGIDNAPANTWMFA
jgi:hypothetical protein